MTLHASDAQQDRILAERYRLIEPIDRGGAGVVWRAHDERLGRDVAVKLLGAEADQAFRERFQEEARRAAKVSHPNVVAIYDEGQDGSDAFMVMEYVRGRTLRELIAERGPMPADQAARLVRQIADALDAAHAAGVVHLDVKPANVIVTDDGRAKLADFGVAAAAHGEAERELVGTARYVAPERIEGAPVDPRSDVYGLGLVAYELLAGRPAFQGVETEDLIRMRLEGPPPSLRTARIGVSPELDDVLRRALARHPAERFSTPGEFSRAFVAVAGRGDATSLLSGAAAPRRLSARSWAIPWDSTLATLAVILVLLGVVAFFLSFGRDALPTATDAPRTQAPAAALTAPNVVGKRLNAAIQEMQSAGFGTVAWDVAQGSSGKACDVARQEPAAGAQFRRGDRATLFYVAGKNCTSKDD